MMPLKTTSLRNWYPIRMVFILIRCHHACPENHLWLQRGRSRQLFAPEFSTLIICDPMGIEGGAVRGRGHQSTVQFALLLTPVRDL